MTAKTTSYDALPFRARRNGSEGIARSLASDGPADAETVEHCARISSRDVIAAWIAAPSLGALCLALLAN